MQQPLLIYLADAVAAQGHSVFTTRPERLNSTILKKGSAIEWIEAVYEALGGTANCWKVEFKLPDGLETEQLRLSLDNSLQFNRYRAISLNSGVYEKYNPDWLQAYRRNCRTLERECLKDGSRLGVWTNPSAEHHFSKAQEPGDFFGTGAAGWRLKAFEEFLADVYLFQGKQEHKRISEYERLMVQGKLIPLQQLLMSRSESSKQYLVKYLSRQLRLPSQQADL